MIDFKYFQGKLLSSRIFITYFKLKNSDIVVNLGSGMGQQALIYKGQYKEMYGIEIDKHFVEFSKEIKKKYNLKNFIIKRANVEKMDFKDNFFDKAIAIDTIQYVQNIIDFCKEVHRVLKPNGKFLITFPRLHDKYVALINFLFRKKNKMKRTKQNPHVIKHFYRLSQWKKIIKDCGFKLIKSRSSTMFPPLHLIGIKRFWYSNRLINEIDTFFCKLALIKNLGQTLLCIFENKAN